MALELAGGRKKQQKQGKYSIIDVDLFKPTKKKYPIYDFEEIRKNQLNEGDSSGDDERFHDREALELVRRLEEKYGRKMKKKRKQFGTEEDFIDKSAGYDLEDQFIDDTEAYDELIPSNLDTAQGGFYVNKGVLEFKEKYDTMDMSDLSDEEDSPIKKAKKRIRVESEDEVEAEGDGEDVEDDEDQEDEEDDDDSSSENITEPSEPATEAPVAAVPVAAVATVPVPTEAPKLQNGVPPVISRPRMVGAPPTKKFAAFHNHSESPSQRAAKAILKKRLIGQPPMKNRFLKANLLSPVKHVLATPVNPQTQPQAEHTKTLASALKELAQTEGPAPSTSSSTGSIVLPATTNGVANVHSNSDEEPTTATTTPGAPHSMVGNSPLLRKSLNGSPRKGLPPLTDTLSNMIDQFKAATANLSAAGQKKRLQNNHVDQVIAIDEQCVKDGLTVHEKARVSHYIAEYCGIQRQSLYARVQKRKEDRKMAAMEGGPSSSTTTPAPTPQASISSSSDEVMVLDEMPAAKSTTKPPAPAAKPPAAPTSTLQLNGFTEQQKQLARKTIDDLVNSMSVDRAKLEAGLSQAQNIQQFALMIQSIVEAHQARTKAAAAAPAKTTTPSTAVVPKTNSAFVVAKPAAQQQVLQKSVKANTAPCARVSKISLEQVIRKLVIRPPTFNNQKQDTPAVLSVLSELIKTFSNMLENEVAMQKTAYEHRLKANPLAHKTPMKFAWDTTFRKRFVDKFNEWWRVLSMVSGGLTEMHQRVFQFIANQILPELKGYETLGGLIVQICRTSPDKSLFLIHTAVKKKLDEEHIVLSQQFVYEDGMKSIAHLFPTPAPVVSNTTTAAAKSVVDDDIQFLDEHGNVAKTNGNSTNATANNKSVASSSVASSSVAQASTSSAPSTSSVTNGTHATPPRPAPASASSSNKTSPSNALKNAALPDMNQIQQLIQMATASGNPQAIQQAAILALQAQSSHFAQFHVQKQAEKEAEKQRIREEKERRQKEKEEKIRQAAEKKAEKMRQIEEKRRQMEEEKRRKAEEKARREEEERQKRLKEQEEKERRMQEERERQEREEMERKRREEEERQRQVTLRIKQEEERARQLEAERQAQLEKVREILEGDPGSLRPPGGPRQISWRGNKCSVVQEEQLAMQLLLEDDDEEEAEEERRAREEAEAEEEERVRKQEEAAAAARAAAMQREAKPFAHQSSSSSQSSSVDVKPTPQQLAQIQAQQQVQHQVQQPMQQQQQQNFVPPQAGFQSPGLHQQPVPQSPKFPGGSPFMANQSGIAQSPQHNFNQPHQSPYAMQHQSPLHHVPQSPVNRHMVPSSPQQTAFAQQQQQQQNHFQQQNGLPQGAQPQALFPRPGPAFPQQPQQQTMAQQGQQQPFGGANAMMQQQQLAMEQQKLALEQQRQQEFQRQQQQQQQQEFQRQAEMQRMAEQQRIAQQQMQMRQQEQELRRQEEIRRQEETRRVEEMRRQEQLQRQRQQEQMQQRMQMQQQGPQHMLQQQQIQQQQQMMLMMQQRQQQMMQQQQQQPQHQPQQQQQGQQFFQGNNYPGF